MDFNAEYIIKGITADNAILYHQLRFIHSNRLIKSTEDYLSTFWVNKNNPKNIQEQIKIIDLYIKNKFTEHKGMTDSDKDNLYQFRDILKKKNVLFTLTKDDLKILVFNNSIHYIENRIYTGRVSTNSEGTNWGFASFDISAQLKNGRILHKEEV